MGKIRENKEENRRAMTITGSSCAQAVVYSAVKQESLKNNNKNIYSDYWNLSGDDPFPRFLRSLSDSKVPRLI